ncbi:MAG TPA: TonB-dependent receptor [Chitinophaga sp.]|uniref:SusC/RagA family TonB-linked outer membrane protein n=1 Tax=Chitinophaga sp. TaxID=1869181 RepID=UPI002CC36A52|nr:TonB-dependent receptor [Chitinophaga sp.]HVI45266.1 TonB-dependent receptor [Chitinophaga sp.]
MRIRFLRLLLTVLLLPALLQAQVRAVKGTVMEGSNPLPGATIMEKGLPSNGAIANEAGVFEVKLKGHSNVLIINMMGFLSQEINVAGKSEIKVSLKADAKGLEDVVVVGFGKQKKITNTGSVSVVSGKEVRQSPTASVQNTLMGRLPGFFSQQRGGQPGADAATFFIRGQSSFASSNKPLVIMDDIEVSYDDVAALDPNEIESISILKDASTTAIYGIKGANGVLVVTTRRGKNGPPSINVKSELGRQSWAYKPKFLNAYESALLTNEALVNGKQAPRFTQEDLDLFKSGADPYGHPDVSWFETLTNNYSLQSRNNLDISGGTEKVKYFVSMGYLWQNGFIKNFSQKADVNNNYYYKRYNFRSNLDIEATKTLSIRTDITGRFGEQNSPITNSPNSNGLIGEIYSYNFLPPFAYPVYNPDDSYGHNISMPGTMNIVGRLALLGYSRKFENDLNVAVGATQKLDVITEGLSVKGTIAYANSNSYSRGLSRTTAAFPAYYYNPKDGSYTPRDPTLYRVPGWKLDYSNSPGDKVLTIQGMVNYDHTFNKDHRFYGLVLFNRNTATRDNPELVPNFIPSNFLGYSSRLGYDYKQKYLIELNAGYNGTDRFVSSKRFGLFPAVSVGWNIAEENFVRKNFPAIDLLKLRGSYGLVGSDDVGGYRYLYEQVYNREGSYSFGELHTPTTGIREGTLGNDEVTWEKEKKFDVGIDLALFDGKLSATIDYFNNYRYDILAPRASIPQMIGVGLPPVNLGRVRNKGFDGEITYRNNIGKFQYSVRGTFSFAKNTIVFQDEPAQRYPWLALTGSSIGQIRGYKFIGFYQDQRDIDTSAVPPTPVIPGDLKYADLNGDKVINKLDQRVMGYPNLPNTVLGLTLGFNWRGISFSALIQSAFNYSLRLTSESIDVFFTNFQPIHQERWTPENKENARFPVLQTPSSEISRGFINPSDFWFINAKYIRLKNVELGYELPASWLKPTRLRGVRVYANAYNILTWTNVTKMYQADPEVSSGGVLSTYPNQKIMNFGVNVTF